ncbi:response regulator transcription factor [Saccharopolyspora indica]|uniref:response regulator n=1 Tax=Saccharopolyspora indica TaxID=1229659 RepID=UPI0022EB5DB6|nr:response regulator transcription factor [Saccharopolyspora indica]MDA3642847.1 response regulator transcription factor [Saccharopolyspora indica]
METRVGVVEDHPLYRAAVTRVLEEAPDVVVDAVAESVAQFAARSRWPGSIVVLDLGIPGVRGAAAVMEMVRRGHPVLVVSAQTDRAEVLGAMLAGARGFLGKDADGEEILHAVREVAAGRSYVASKLADVVLETAPLKRAPGARIDLSHREAEVLARLAAGERDQDIAVGLRISIRTVRSYLDRIRDKTGLRRRPALTAYAIEHGFATCSAPDRLSA